MTVKQFMTANPVTVHPETSLPEAAQLMKRGRFRRLPVVSSCVQGDGFVARGCK